MSLINQMLHDLDERRHQSSVRSSGYVVAGLHSPRSTLNSATSKNRLSLGTNILVASLVILLGAVIWRYVSLVSESGNVTPVAMDSAPAVIEQETPLDKAVEQDITPASIHIPVTGDQDRLISQDHEKPLSGGMIAKFQQPAIDNPVDEMPVIPRQQHAVQRRKPAVIEDKPKLKASFTKAPVSERAHASLTKKADDVVNRAGLKKKFRPPTPEQLADVSFRSGLAYIQKGNINEGMRELKNTLSHYQGHAKAREILAGLLIKSGQNSDAAALLKKGIELHPEHSQFAKLYSRVLLEEGKTQAALQVLETNRPLLIQDPEYYAILAAVYQQVGQYQFASAIYNQLVAIQPNSGIFWMGLGISLEADGNSGKAIQAYKRAKASGTLDQNLLQFIDGKIITLKHGGVTPAA